MSLVLDSSALIAIVKDEPGAERADAALPSGRVSAVILAETVMKLIALGFDGEAAAAEFQRAGLTVEPFEAADIAHVVRIQALETKPLSLADRICLALAMRLQLPCLTGDRAWLSLDLPVACRSLR